MRLMATCLWALLALFALPAKAIPVVPAVLHVSLSASSRQPTPIVVSGAIQSTSGRSLMLWDSDVGNVRVFFSTKATITGAVVKGATVRVEGTLIEDFIRTTSIEVMATSVTVERAP